MGKVSSTHTSDRINSRDSVINSSKRRPIKRPKTKAEAAAIERLRAICMALPEATEKIAWGEPTWRVKGKLFAQLDNHHHGADHLAVWLPAPLGEQESMIFLDPVRFFRPPYVGPRGWVGVRIDGRPDWALVATLVKQAYREVAPPRLRAAGAAAPPRVLERKRD
jgi:predicted DNA-binding protein (MmcQ/YjbR family)